MHHSAFELISTLLGQIWRILSQRWLLLLCGGITFCLVICAFVLKQLPANLENDPNLVNRWFQDTILYYDTFGNSLHNLGLFTILHSQRLQIFLLLTGLLLLIKLANLIDAVYLLSRLPNLLKQPIAVNDPDASLEEVAGYELALHPTYQTIFRRRSAHVILPEKVTAETSAYLESQFGQLHRETLVLSEQTTAPEMADILEERLLAIHSPETIYLRILSVVGLLLAALAVSFTVVLGWEIETEPLAPGESFRSVQENFESAYHIVTPVTENDRLATHLKIHIGDAAERLSMATGSFVKIDAVSVWAELDQPALLVSSIGEKPLLARPEQYSPSTMMGLLFPNPGSEEFILLPRQRIGLRIVRMSGSNLAVDENNRCQNTVVVLDFPEGDTPAFIVEIVREALEDVDVQAVERYCISDRQPTTLPVDGLDALIRLDPMPSLRVAAYYRPELWLVWPALVMILIGAIGFWRQPRFLIVQICPWPIERAVVVIQGNVVADVESVEAWLDEQHQDVF